MYSASAIRMALKSPSLILAEINRFYENGSSHRTHTCYNKYGVEILEADWDNLIILDACRFDTFKECASDLPGKLEERQSKASATDQFLRQNFSNQTITDTIYITANPQLYRIENGIYDVDPINVTFHKQIDMWRDNWDEEHRTVRPEPVTEATLSASNKYPNKRLISHYLQPHAPYIGPTGTEELPTDYLNFWSSFRDGKFDINLETAKKAYQENVELVIPHVKTLLSELEGKTVVTSDHGELLGERDSPIPIRRFGHPSYTFLPELINVPWLVNKNGSRKEIVAEDQKETPQDEEEVEDKTVKQRLEDLGYIEQWLT